MGSTLAKKLGGIALAVLASMGIPDAEAETWHPAPVEVRLTPFASRSSTRDDLYRPIERATQPWRLCIAIPHVRDSFWHAVSYGLAAEVTRLDVAMRLAVAGSYERLDAQRRQLQSCVADGVDALIIASISADGVSDIVQRAADKGMPVVDLVNGMSPAGVSARAMSSYSSAASLVGRYLAMRAATGDSAVRVVWFPGPEGAQWALDADRGLTEALSGSGVTLVTTRFGNTSHREQAALLRRVIEEGIEFDAFIGSSGGAVAATRVLRERRLASRVRVYAFNYGPAVHRGIQRGTIEAAVEDQPVVTARLAVDLAVRALEGRLSDRDIGPSLRVVDRSTIGDLTLERSLAPTGYELIYRRRWSLDGD